MDQPRWLGESFDFPDTQYALDDPNGLLAVGGDLAPGRLLAAYHKGIFPWYSDDQPILWWSPSPRMILTPSEIHIGRSTRKLLNKNLFTIRADTAFADVIEHCAAIERPDQEGTWITDEMQEAYLSLHRAGHAHSIEAWQGDNLVGGLYGIAIGKAFFGESMFSQVSGASKVAFVRLAQQLADWGYGLIDCQMHTQYLESMGAKEIPRHIFESRLRQAVEDTGTSDWSKWDDHPYL